MSLTVRLASPLRAAAGGQATLMFEAADVSSLTGQIAERHPELAARVLRDGAFGPFVSVFVDGEDLRFLPDGADLTGTRVVEILPAMSGGAVAESVTSLIQSNEVFGSFIDETIGIAARQTRDTVLFAVGSPSAAALQSVGAGDLARAVIERDGPSALGYGVTEGDPELRAIVAAEMAARGLVCGTENVIVTAGALQAIDLAVRVFVRPGDVALVESPHFTNAIASLRNHGARPIEVPIDDEGMDVAAASRVIDRTGVRPRVVFVVPNFQNPTGATLSLARRHALVDLAERYGSVIIEDDPYRQLRYRGADLPTIAALARERVTVIYCGSFSKVFLPGLRVGWAVAPPEVVARMTAVKQTVDSSTSSLGQRMVAHFHRDDRMVAHVAALRVAYRVQQDRALGALAREFAGTNVTWNHPEGGFYLWVRLQSGRSARRLFTIALEEGVAFVPGDAFGLGDEHANALRLSFSSPTPERIEEGVCRLRRAFDRCDRP
jgi:2-aminoadipate transaminase